MHHKKSEAHKLINESRGFSSSFNPTHHSRHLHKHRAPANGGHCFAMCQQSLPPPSSSPITLPCLRLAAHLRCAHLLRLHFRVLILLSLPSIYVAATNRRGSFLLDALSLLSLSLALLVSLNLALPRLLAIRRRLFRAKPVSPPPNPSSSPGPPAVVWSIGSRPRSEKGSNSGSWVRIYGNRDVYEGEFHGGKSSGSGVYYYRRSGRYEGDWVDEKYDGFGVETWARGSRYQGQYRKGLRHGVGVYRSYTGDVYGGEWSSGQCHGRGVHTCDDGSKYVGEFKWGLKHGLGHYHFRNGDTYSGEYFTDKMHGFGVYRFANGHRYEGAWHEGIRQGLGMYTFRNAEVQSGHWQNGFLDVSSVQSTHPESPCLVDHARVLNTVQEAQRAAERAQNIAMMDELLKTVISEANKAATAARIAAAKAVQNQMCRDKAFESEYQSV